MLSRGLINANRLINNRQAMFSAWGALTSAPADPILGLNEAFKTDTNPKKVLLGMGAYRDDDNKPFILDCVKEAEQLILDRNMDHEYAGIQGVDSFIQKSLELAWGKDNKALNEKRIAGCQSLSGTGSLRLALQFFKTWYPHKDVDVMIPVPTWPIHRTINDIVGNSWKPYRYYHFETKGLDFDGMLEDLNNAKDHSMTMFHVCAHNPTGVDPTPAQWEKILEVCLRKKMLCLFDSAYQGFASGDLETDAYSLKLFSQHTDNLILCQSFAKNFGLYGERAGCLSILTGSEDEKKVVMSRVKQIARPIYSNPPIHGARIVDIILSDERLTKMWHNDLKVMSGRMFEMRHGLVNKLKDIGNEHNWQHVIDQIGMFAYTGLN